jgi:hypothetical protein
MPKDPADYRSVGYIGPRTRTTNTKDAALAKDLAAYKAMRRQGFQPPHVGGSHDLARDATLAVEIEMGHVYKTKQGKNLAEEGVDRCYEMGLKGT